MAGAIVYISIVATTRDIRILVAEDSTTMRKIVVSLLRGLDFETIDEAADGSSALHKLQRRSYDLVISDWNMAPMTGLELLRAVRADPRLSELPFLMLTSQSGLDGVMAAKAAGATNYLAKPFTAGSLGTKLHAMLGTG